MTIKRTIIISNTYNAILSVSIGLFFAYILEKLYTIHQIIITLNYYMGKSYIESTDMLIDLIRNNTVLSNYTLFSLFLLLVSFFILLYFIESGKNNLEDLEKRMNVKQLNSYNIMLFFCIFIWIYFIFLSFIGSIKNFNILIHPQQILSTEIEKDISTIILTMAHNTIYLKTNILNILYVVFSTVIISLYFSLNMVDDENKMIYYMLLVITIICTILVGIIYYYSPELSIIGEYTIRFTGIEEGFLGPLFS